MSSKEGPPTESELQSAIEDCFYAASQCATYHYWILLAQPAVEADEAAKEVGMHRFMSNGLTEAVLMFFRKTHEFFKNPESSDRSDNLYAYRWTDYPGLGPIYPPDVILELHKRVGHLTIREARHGKIQWPVFEMAIEALDRWIHFFEFIASSYYSENQEISNQCGRSATALETVKRAMIRDKNLMEEMA